MIFKNSILILITFRIIYKYIFFIINDDIIKQITILSVLTCSYYI